MIWSEQACEMPWFYRRGDGKVVMARGGEIPIRFLPTQGARGPMDGYGSAREKAMAVLEEQGRAILARMGVLDEPPVLVWQGPPGGSAQDGQNWSGGRPPLGTVEATFQVDGYNPGWCSK